MRFFPGGRCFLQARRDLSDHARLLATLSPQESDSSGFEIDEENPPERRSETWTPSHEADEDMAVDTKVSDQSYPEGWISHYTLLGSSQLAIIVNQDVFNANYRFGVLL